jgi:hypothetical protein
MGVILFGGGGGAQYSLPEQANLTLIFFPKIVGGGGGEVTKNVFPYIPQKMFPDIHTYKHSTKFSQHSKKNSHNFRKDTKILLRHIKIFQKSLCFAEFRSDFYPTVNILEGARGPRAPPAHTPMSLEIVTQYFNQSILTQSKPLGSK